MPASGGDEKPKRRRTKSTASIVLDSLEKMREQASPSSAPAKSKDTKASPTSHMPASTGDEKPKRRRAKSTASIVLDSLEKMREEASVSSTTAKSKDKSKAKTPPTPSNANTLSEPRSSRSSTAHAAAAAAAAAAASSSETNAGGASTNHDESSPLSSRAKRRGRGLPTSKNVPEPDVSSLNQDQVTASATETPAATDETKATSNDAVHSTSAVAPATPGRSPRTSSRTTAAAAAAAMKRGIMIASDSKKKNFQVSVKVSGRVVLPVDELAPPDLTSSSAASTSINALEPAPSVAAALTTSSSSATTANTGSAANNRNKRSTRSSTSNTSLPTPGTVPSTASGEVPTTSNTSPSSANEATKSLPLGHDGNMFYCHVCGGVGDVVCCDGCPHVYHRPCVPQNTKSRISLDNDDDPWFCPDCVQTNQEVSSSSKRTRRGGRTVTQANDAGGATSNAQAPTDSVESSSTTSLKQQHASAAPTSPTTPSPVTGICFECNEAGTDLKQCQGCQEWIHFPTCDIEEDDSSTNKNKKNKDATASHNNPERSTSTKATNGEGTDKEQRILCSICRVEEEGTDMNKKQADEKKARTTVSAASDDDDDDVEEEEEEEDDDDDDDNNDDDDDATTSTTGERRKQSGDMEVDGDDNTVQDDDNEEESSQAPKSDVENASVTDRPTRTRRARLKARKIEEDDDDDEEEDEEEDDDDEGSGASPSSGSRRGSSRSASPRNAPSNPKKRTRPALPSSKVKANMEAASSKASPTAPSKKRKADKRESKKKRKKTDPSSGTSTTTKKNPGESTSATSPRGKRNEADDTDPTPYTYSHTNANGNAFQATPAFFYFLNENRHKIDKSLTRKHRIFNRLPKGYERNELVAKEGAIWWSKLKQSEIRRYMNMSMREFEQRIIEWKEEKNIRDMLLEDNAPVEGDEVVDSSYEDEILTYENHKRLFFGTTVGSKPFKPEPGTSHNRVLLELLQDMRFHPMPMFMASRSETEYGQMDFDRITIPYFDVHGPFSTSVGDECLGCTRGWTHFCNVLKRRIPAVEHRAKLQPPLSSLIATRVGLGLRPKAMEANNNDTEDAKQVPLFSTRELPDVSSSKKLPPVPSEHLSDPSSRADDIVQFIEETMAMKVPEPPRPDKPNRGVDGNSGFGAGTMKGLKRRYDTMNGQDSNMSLNKCGRCRTVIQTDTGCIQCRRAQLVINMSKRTGSDEKKAKGEKDYGGGGSSKGCLKVQTFMCGRVNMKEGSGEVQNDGDEAVANGILRQRWTPFTILPPQTLISPTPKSKHSAHRRKYQSQDDDEDPSMAEVTETAGSDTQLEPDLASEPGGSAQDDGSNSSRSRADSMDIDEGDGSDSSKPSRPASQRLRSARIAGAAATQSEVIDDADRQRWALRCKEEGDQLQKKCLSVACCGILLALMRRDPLLLFASPVTAEGYSTIVKNPMDFGKIRGNVLDGKYATLGSFVSDCKLLCTNALAYNPPGSIYWKTAKELQDVLAVMQKRASTWISVIKDSHACAWRRRDPSNNKSSQIQKDGEDQATSSTSSANPTTDEFLVGDPFTELRKKWPDAVEMLQDSDWLQRSITADFVRTRENETAFYGALAVRRTAAAAEAALASYPDTGGMYNTVSRRSHAEDEALRRAIDERVSEITDPVELKDLPTWREEAVIRVLRRAQSRRLDGRSGSQNGCARCDGNYSDSDMKRFRNSQPVHLGRSRRKNNEASRIDPSRMSLSTGTASQTTKARIDEMVGGLSGEKDLHEKANSANQVAVTVRGSGIHGWGLFADQNFQKGDVVAEYIGEYVSLAVTEAREKMYQEQRIQDYQFRLDDQLVIDATMRGGHGRYINHNCSPNCIAQVISGSPPNEHLKRVIIIAERDIKPLEELTYDYQFPLELDLNARIPCNCHSEQCRGFMNWDLPEKGSNSRVVRAQKRGANMRDRIRRLGRPLKSDRGDDDDDDDLDDIA